MVAKLLAMLLSPVVRLISWAYQIIAFLLAYGLLGLSLFCLFAIVMELVYEGIFTQDAFGYLAMAAISYAARWVVLFVGGLLLALQDAVYVRAHSPIHREYAAY